VHSIGGSRKITPLNLNISFNNEHSCQLQELATLPTWKRPAVSSIQLTARAPASGLKNFSDEKSLILTGSQTTDSPLSHSCPEHYSNHTTPSL